MRKSLVFFFLLIVFSSCSKQFIQVFDTSTTNTIFKDQYYIYETDTIKITYSFWASKGVMSFAVFNKLDKPIYIDWKNSSFITNDNKLNYWIEETQTNIVSYYGGYFYNGAILKPGVTIQQGIQMASSTTIKLEKVTFIPPKSNYYRSQFYLLPGQHCKLKKDSQSEIVSRNDNPDSKTKIYSDNFTIHNSPLRFQ